MGTNLADESLESRMFSCCAVKNIWHWWIKVWFTLTGTVDHGRGRLWEENGVQEDMDASSDRGKREKFWLEWWEMGCRGPPPPTHLKKKEAAWIGACGQRERESERERKEKKEGKIGEWEREGRLCAGVSHSRDKKDGKGWRWLITGHKLGNVGEGGEEHENQKKSDRKLQIDTTLHRWNETASNSSIPQYQIWC